VAKRPGALSVLVKYLLRLRAIRFALVGGVGIPINMGFLWVFHSVIGLPMIPAWVCAFVCSALINFYANQRFTFREQTHLRGWDWPIRAAKAQMSSLSGLLVNVSAFTLLMHFGMHYLPADAAGIVAAFSVNFVVSTRYVFTPARHRTYSSSTHVVADLAEIEGVA
jgi:putative flippase GtrA